MLFVAVFLTRLPSLRQGGGGIDHIVTGAWKQNIAENMIDYNNRHQCNNRENDGMYIRRK